MRFDGSAMDIAVSAARTRSLASRHRLVRQADERERGQAGRDGALHLDDARLDAFECHCVGARDHVSPLTDG